MSNRFTGISKTWCCLKTFEDLQTEHPWWATATGPSRPRSARGCLPGPSAVHRHPPKRSRRGALHTSLPAFQVVVVVVMVVTRVSDNAISLPVGFFNKPFWFFRAVKITLLRVIPTMTCRVGVVRVNWKCYLGITRHVGKTQPVWPHKSFLLLLNACHLLPPTHQENTWETKVKTAATAHAQTCQNMSGYDLSNIWGNRNQTCQ